MTKVKIEIKNRLTGDVLFEYEKENNTIKDTLREGVKRGVDFSGAYLPDVDLVNADLKRIDLHGAYLVRANMVGANLGWANLENANLRGARLVGANLRSANLSNTKLGGVNMRGADLRDAKLEGYDLRGVNLKGADIDSADLGEFGKLKGVLIIGCIGSRREYSRIFKTDKGIFVQCGCYKGSVDEFVDKVKETHKGNTHERDYLAMIEFAKIKFQEE